MGSIRYYHCLELLGKEESRRFQNIREVSRDPRVKNSFPGKEAADEMLCLSLGWFWGGMLGSRLSQLLESSVHVPSRLMLCISLANLETAKFHGKGRRDDVSSDLHREHFLHSGLDSVHLKR